jgi:hypothetical protein
MQFPLPTLISGRSRPRPRRALCCWAPVARAVPTAGISPQDLRDQARLRRQVHALPVDEQQPDTARRPLREARGAGTLIA